MSLRVSVEHSFAIIYRRDAQTISLAALELPLSVDGDHIFFPGRRKTGVQRLDDVRSLDDVPAMRMTAQAQQDGHDTCDSHHDAEETDDGDGDDGLGWQGLTSGDQRLNHYDGRVGH